MDELNKKMKIGIMTMHCVPNYGAIMQSFATVAFIRKILKERGVDNVDVKILDYQPLIKKRKYSFRALIQSTIYDFSLVKENLKLVFSKNRCITKMVHEYAYSFYRENDAITPEISKSSLNSCSEYFDAIIVGSDQVWNPFGMKRDLSYLLDFYDGSNKFAFSSSFGISEFPEHFVERYKNELSKFKCISTREIEGKKIIKYLTGSDDCKTTIDPALLLDAEYYRNYEITDICDGLEKDYSLVYLAMQSETIINYALSNEQSKKQIVVCGMPDVICTLNDPRIKKIEVLSPGQFLGLFDKADNVYTNSFHGIVFSLVYEKQFFIEYNNIYSKSNSRLENIVKMFNLESRLIIDTNRIMADSWIDYEIINPILKKERKFAEKYITTLLSVLSDEGK